MSRSRVFALALQGQGFFSSLPSLVLPVARPSMSFSRLSFLQCLVELFSKVSLFLSRAFLGQV